MLAVVAARPAPAEVRVDTTAACGLTAGDQRAAVQRALDRAAGGELVVPGGCRLMIGPPPPGDAALVVAAHTRLRCESHAAGFFLARRACAGGRYDGAACRADADCPDGRCDTDVPAGPFSAPEDERPATLLAAAAGATDVRLVGCTIWANGQDAYGRCAGGTNDGLPCAHRCAGRPELACDEDGDCPAGAGPCEGLADCRTASPEPGTCSGEPGEPVGPVVPVDLSAATDAVVEDVWVLDHRRGDRSFAVGGGSHAAILDSDNTKSAVVVPAALGWAPLIQARFHVGAAATIAGGTAARNVLRGLDFGLRASGGRVAAERNDVTATGPAGEAIHVAGGAAAVVGNRAAAAANVVYAADHGNRIEDNELTGTGERTIGIWLAGMQAHVTGNLVGAYTCVAGNPFDTPEAPGAANVSFVGNRCVGGNGPKVIIQGPGWLVADNYLAWGTLPPAAVVSIGGAGDRASGAGHATITGNMLHSNLREVALVAFAEPGPRCDGGARAGAACTGETPEECPDAQCAPQRYVDVMIGGNSFLNGGTGVDLGALSHSAAFGVRIVGNAFSLRLTTGIRFPASGVEVRDVWIADNHLAGVRTPLDGFRWTMGRLGANGGVDTVDVVELMNAMREPATSGDAVQVDPGADGAFRAATSGFAGIVLDAPRPGALGAIATRGTTLCNVTGDVHRGDRLAPGATPGKLAAVRRTLPAVAVSLAEHAAGADAPVRCLVAPSPARPWWTWLTGG